jgi:hypothetical protein
VLGFIKKGLHPNDINLCNNVRDFADARLFLASPPEKDPGYFSVVLLLCSDEHHMATHCSLHAVIFGKFVIRKNLWSIPIKRRGRSYACTAANYGGCVLLVCNENTQCNPMASR